MMHNKLLIKISNFIVNFRYLFLFLFISLIIICCFNINNNKVNYDVISYLPNETETIKGKKLIEQEFGKINEIQLLITNISYENVLEKLDSINKIKNVKNILFDNTENYYKENNALIIIEIDKLTNKEKNNLKEDIINIVKNEEYYLYSEDEKSYSNNEVSILLVVVSVIALVILLTSRSYFDVVLVAIILSVSILINIGSNFILGKISNITNPIVIIIQLCLTLNYFIIFLNHYTKEIDDNSNKKLAIKKTLYKSIPEIITSSFTIIILIISLQFINFKIGNEFGIALSKSIICSMLTVLLLSPSLLMIFNDIIHNFRHRLFMPNLKKISKLIVTSRKIIFPLFIILSIASLLLIPQYNYTYTLNSEKEHTLDEEQIALNKIENIFGQHNRLIILAKSKDKDYFKELQIAKKILQDNKILNVTNIGNTKIKNNAYLGSSINHQEFSTTFNIDIDKSNEIYKTYAQEKSENIKLNDIDNYRISIINLIYFLYDHQEDLPLNEDTNIIDYYQKVNNKIELFESKKYSRFIIDYKGDIESNDTFKLLDMLRDDVKTEYDEIMLVGESISARDLKTTFYKDNFQLSLITLLFVVIIIFFTSKSIGMTIIISFTVEACVLINFGFNFLLHNKLFFVSYIIVFIIQTCLILNFATIIYRKYQLYRKRMSKLNTIQRSTQESLPTIIINGLILAITAFILSYMSNSEIVFSVGILLGINTIISIISVVLILPTLLFTFDKFIQTTTLKSK